MPHTRITTRHQGVRDRQQRLHSGAAGAAGIWEFANRNVFGATAFCSYGAFWLSFWFLSQFSAGSLPAADAGKAVGLYLLAWAIFTAYMTISAWRVSMGVFAVFVFLTLTYIAHPRKPDARTAALPSGSRLFRPGQRHVVGL